MAYYSSLQYAMVNLALYTVIKWHCNKILKKNFSSAVFQTFENMDLYKVSSICFIFIKWNSITAMREMHFVPIEAIAAH